MKGIDEVECKSRLDNQAPAASTLMCTILPLNDDVQPADAGHNDGGQRSGLPMWPTQTPRVVVDLELVNQLRDEEC